MKQYSALRAISGILKFIGWATIVVAVLFFVFAILNSSNGSTPYVGGAGVPIIAFIIMIATVISGIFIVASGELIDAVVDIATNTAHLPMISQSSERMVGFFDQMSAKVNGPKSSSADVHAQVR